MYYFTERMSDEYQYDQQELTNVVMNEDDMNDITFIKNIFK